MFSGFFCKALATSTLLFKTAVSLLFNSVCDALIQTNIFTSHRRIEFISIDQVYNDRL